ncbi:hypothetical protein ACIPW5_36495 [Streptomyces sp. NPDC090077]|uniref:hypothetical protein n=1 Tax=Streptomyces sp. NPDC090077 TaxID=3365938 RepID=UPI00381A4B9C
MEEVVLRLRELLFPTVADIAVLSVDVELPRKSHEDQPRSLSGQLGLRRAPDFQLGTQDIKGCLHPWSVVHARSPRSANQHPNLVVPDQIQP